MQNSKFRNKDELLESLRKGEKFSLVFAKLIGSKEVLGEYENNPFYVLDAFGVTFDYAQAIALWKSNTLSLNHLKELTPELSKILRSWGGEELFLNGLEAIDKKALRYLCEWEGTVLSLSGLKELEPSVARVLREWGRKGDFKFRTLHLSGIKEINPKIAKILSKSCFVNLYLNGLSEIDAKSAHWLTRWAGKELFLQGIERLEPKTAKEFCFWETGENVWLGKKAAEEALKQQKMMLGYNVNAGGHIIWELLDENNWSPENRDKQSSE